MDLSNLVKTYNDRLRHNFFGPFILSWCIVNWKLIFFLIVSDYEASIRIDEGLKYTDTYSLVLIPLAVSLFNIFLMPYISWFFDKPKYHVTALNDKREKIRTDTLLGYQLESAKVEFDIEQLRIGEKMKKEYDNKILDFKKELEGKVNHIQNLNEKLNTSNTEIEKFKKELKKAIDNSTSLEAKLNTGFSLDEMKHIQSAIANLSMINYTTSFMGIAEKFHYYKSIKKRKDYNPIKSFLENIGRNGKVNKKDFYSLSKSIQEYLIKNLVNESIDESKENVINLNENGMIVSLLFKTEINL